MEKQTNLNNHPVTGTITSEQAKELLHKVTNFSYPSDVEDLDRQRQMANKPKRW